MRLRDYRAVDATRITSLFMNQVTDDFSNAMAEVYLDFQDLKKRNQSFKTAANTAMSYLIQKNNAATSLLDGLQVTAYETPDSFSNIQLDTVFGQITLAETDRVTHTPTQEDNFGRRLAIPSVGVYVGATESSMSASQDARAIVDNEGDIWVTELAPADTSSGSIWVRIATPVIARTPNFVSVYPLAGTTVNVVKVKRQGGWTEFDPNSTWPVKFHQNFSDYTNEVRVQLTGVPNQAGNYVFCLRKVDIYSVRYATQGIVTYTTKQAFTTVSMVTLNTPYYYPVTAQTPSMVRLRVLTLNGISLYDSSQGADPFSVPAGPQKVQVEATLYRVDGNTPVVRTIV